MLKYYNFDIVCQEIPDQISLAINITGCPGRCPGCHSPWLQQDLGEALTTAELDALLQRYAKAVTCVCFMGGDQSPLEVEQLALHVREKWPHLKTGWYSGKEQLPEKVQASSYNYIKLGPYIEALGGLRSAHSNQCLYRIDFTQDKEILWTPIPFSAKSQLIGDAQ